MSTRSQVFMINSGVYLYQHSDGYNLPEEVQEALRLKLRWNDEEYLTRVIFETLIKGSLDREHGFGIGTIQHSDIEWLVEVDVDAQTIVVKNGYGQKFHEVWNGPFEKFCKKATLSQIQANIEHYNKIDAMECYEDVWVYLAL